MLQNLKFRSWEILGKYSTFTFAFPKYEYYMTVSDVYKKSTFLGRRRQPNIGIIFPENYLSMKRIFGHQ